MSETQLYRHFDGNGELLYVGISMTVLIRTRSHSYTSAWFKDVRRIEYMNKGKRAFREGVDRVNHPDGMIGRWWLEGYDIARDSLYP